MIRLVSPTLLSLLPFIAACDAAQNSTLRDALIEEVDAADITLADAIEAARAAAPGAVVLEAELDFDSTPVAYDVELLDGEQLREIDISPADGSVLRDRADSLDADDLAEARTAASLASEATRSVAIIQAAEANTGGIAFEVEADGDDGVLEVELLVDGVIWEVELLADGTIAKSEVSDDQRDGDDSPDDD